MLTRSGLLSSLSTAVRPFVPRLVPLFVLSLFIPLILLLSIAAGWFVWSSLAVTWQVPLYLQYGDGVSPYAFVSLPPLNHHQRYDISLDLVLPYSESNVALGNFMTSLTLSTSSNKTVVHVRRPAITLPPSSLLGFSRSTSSRINVPLLESFTPVMSNMAASVKIGREDRWRTLGVGQEREVSVASARLQGFVVPHGVRGLAIRFPLLSAITSTGIFFSILSLMLVTCILPLLLPTSQGDKIEGEQKPSELTWRASSTSPSPLSPTTSKAIRRRRRSRGSHERSIKTESAEESLPVEAEDSTRGLRRRYSKPAIHDEK